MILITLSGLTAYRMHVPKWAVAPTSGAGAGRHGGRVNRIGLNALYLALDVQTAVSEYQQISPLMPPGTLVSYQVTADPVVDFTGGYQSGVWSPLWEEFYCDWRAAGLTSASNRQAGSSLMKPSPLAQKASSSDHSCQPKE
ncbi:RES domain-containing protein [Paraburkholderia sp. IW21]|uniref:RES domain-containing protein n=1 Tax=Paraburkholderia sp. IW21 TaxID=3242488 RepID=UPI0035208E2A